MWTLDPQPLLTAEQIRERVVQLAQRIVDDFGTGSPFIAAGLLRGCYVFAADLLREIAKRGAELRELDFMICSSYGDGAESSRNIKVQRDLTADIRGRRVLLIDDIIDTGHTLKLVRNRLAAREPELLRIVTLLDKPERREAEIEADYMGFTIPNVFVVGYGLDYGQRYRELPYIGVMRETGQQDATPVISRS